MKKYNLFIAVFVLFLMANMILLPKLYLNATMEGIVLWATKVTPSVLVFAFLVKILFSTENKKTENNFLKKFCVKSWGCPALSCKVFLCSILSGYPIGTIMISDLYQQGQLTRSQAGRMCSFCSTSGPMFILGTVGVSMLGNASFGYIILFSHILGAFFNGMLYRKINLPQIEHAGIQISQEKFDISKIINSTFTSVLSIGVVIAVFSVIITFFQPLINIFPSQISPIVEGFIEMTKGCSSIAQNLIGMPAIAAATFIISFGGISTIVQSIALLNKIQIPIKLFVLQKISHAAIATVISLFLSFIII